MKTRARWSGRLWLALGAFAVALVLGEIALRILKPQPIGFDTSRLWEPVNGLRWQRRANLDVRVNTGEREVRVLSDSARHRVGATQPAGASEIRILAVGDSMVEALQVEAEQTMLALLAHSLSSAVGRRVDVVNAGVGGWDPNQYLIATRQELEQCPYDLVLIFVYLDNDIVGQRVAGYPAATTLSAPPIRPLEDGFATALDRLGVRVQGLLRERSHLFVFGQNLWELRRARAGGRAHLLSNAMRANASAPAWTITSDILEDIGAAGDRCHTPVLFILLPPAHYIDPRFLTTLARAFGIDAAAIDVQQPAERLSAELKRRRRAVFDPAPELRRAFEAGEHDLYGHVDTHLAPAGHEVMAHFLEPIVLSHLTPAKPTSIGAPHGGDR